MESLWEVKTYPKYVASLLRVYWRQDLVLSKEELIWVFVGQRTAKLRSGKLWGFVAWWADRQDFFRSPIWKLVALHPFDLHGPTIHPWKDLNLAINIPSDHKTDSVLKIVFFFSQNDPISSQYFALQSNKLA